MPFFHVMRRSQLSLSDIITKEKPQAQSLGFFVARSSLDPSKFLNRNSEGLAGTRAFYRFACCNLNSLADAQGAEDGQGLQDGDADQHGAEFPGIHQAAEDQRSERQAEVEPGINETIDPPVGRLAEAGGGRLAHQQVARRAGDPGAEADTGHQRKDQTGRQHRAGEQYGQQGGQTQRAGDQQVVFALLGEEAAKYDAAGAADQVGREREGRRGQRQAVHGLQDGAGEVLDGAEGGGDEEEEQEAQPDRPRTQEGEERAGVFLRLFGVMRRRIGDGFAAPEEQCDGEQGDDAG